MIALFLAGSIGLLVAGLGAPFLIKWLRHSGIGQQIRNDGPTEHSAKAGTPTMGGLAIVAATGVGFGVSHIEAGTSFLPSSGIMVIAVMLGAAAVGVVDDWIKVRRQRSLGLSKRAKLGAQIVVAAGFSLGVLYWPGVTTALSFTRYDLPGIGLGRVGWVIFATIVVIGASNAVNLTDGVDGLAAGSATFGLVFLAIVGYWQSRHMPIYGPATGVGVRNPLDLALVAVAMAGSCAGFLWWNAAPARLFMGDTGSLAIGAVLAALCLQMQLDLLLPILGGLFVLETLSVVVQVASYRIFGRRVFLMAPLHHHFEMLGWPETTVIIRFWILAGLCVASALGIFYADFISVGLTK